RRKRSGCTRMERSRDCSDGIHRREHRVDGAGPQGDRAVQPGDRVGRNGVYRGTDRARPENRRDRRDHDRGADGPSAQEPRGDPQGGARRNRRDRPGEPMRRALLVAGVALLAACPGATTKPIPADRLAAVPEADRELAESLFTAEQVVAGRLVQVAEAQEYERPGQLVFGAGGTKATVALAYSGEIRVDSTLVGRADRMLHVTFFAPRGSATPPQ